MNARTRTQQPGHGLPAHGCISRDRLKTALAAAVADPVHAAHRLDEHSVDVYLSPNRLLSAFFWHRLSYVTELVDWALRAGLAPPDEAFDLGGGSGLVSALLAVRFRRVTLLDLDTTLARTVLGEMGIGNVRLLEGDALRHAAPWGADLVVAADVLEHFPVTAEPLKSIRSWLRPGGILITSLPTENLLYRALRVPFGKTKPHDHYFGAAAVENAIMAAGFVAVRRLHHPLRVPVLPLFRVTAWRMTA